MKKNNITLVFVAIVFSIIVGMIIGKSLLKYKEGEPDVVGSFSMNRDENFTVVANRKNISDKEAFARLLLKMYKENSFHSIKFSTDHGYATSLDMTVYSWKEDIENGESIMQIEFRPIEYGKDYDLVHNPDKYVLHGAISPMLGIGPNDIKLKELMHRLQSDVEEVIIATNSSLEGETTAMYISKLIKPTGIKVTRIASGVPVGGDLEYIDEVTLLRALEGRIEL